MHSSIMHPIGPSTDAVSYKLLLATALPLIDKSLITVSNYSLSLSFLSFLSLPSILLKLPTLKPKPTPKPTLTLTRILTPYDIAVDRVNQVENPHYDH